MRVSSNRSATAAATSPAIARQWLAEMSALDGHTFLVDDVRGVIGQLDPELLLSHRDVTDAHLLAVAERHGAGS